MRIAVCSDLHLEFGDLHMPNEQNADVLILGGDILVASDLESWLHDESAQLIAATSTQKARCDRYFNFVRQCLEEFKHVVFVMGNHEHYHGDFAKSANIIRGTFEPYSNFHFLDKEWAIINGVLFYGGTLWTDFNREDFDTMHRIKFMMNDFNCVKNSGRMVTYQTTVTDPDNPGQTIPKFKERVSTFAPEDALEDHKKYLAGLQEVMALHSGLPTVVVGHHAPSRLSTHPKYAHEVLMNGAYSSNLEYVMQQHPQIKLWTHGHTHEDFDYIVEQTRVVCNPRGYINYESKADEFQLKYVDI